MLFIITLIIFALIYIVYKKYKGKAEKINQDKKSGYSESKSLVKKQMSNLQKEDHDSLSEQIVDNNSSLAVSIPYQDILEKIPDEVRNLLYFKNDDPKNFSLLTIKININLFSGNFDYEKPEVSDPSTIYLKSHLSIPFDIKMVEEPGYYPTFAELSPEQKYVYLTWLQNINDNIPIGYVFIFYYGLERQLLTGKFDDAFNMVARLRRIHNNPSFLSYSGKALLFSSLAQKRYDKLYELEVILDSTNWYDAHILLAYKTENGITMEQLILILKTFSEVNKRYINDKNAYFEYLRILEEKIVNKYGSNIYPIQKLWNINKLPKSSELVFANISFPSSIRTLEVPSFFAEAEFRKEMIELSGLVHEIVKLIMKEKRKKKH